MNRKWSPRKKTIFCLFALRRGLAPLHSRVLFTPICPTLALLKGLWMSQLQFTSSTRNKEETFGHLVREGRLRNGVYFTVRKQEGVVRCTRSLASHLVPPVKRKHLPHVAWRTTDLYTHTHIESTTSVFLCPLLSSCPLTSFLLFPPCGVTWLSGQLCGVLTGSFTRLLCINLQILEHLYRAAVSDHKAVFRLQRAPIFNQWLVCVLCFRTVLTVTPCTIIASHQILSSVWL